MADFRRFPVFCTYKPDIGSFGSLAMSWLSPLPKRIASRGDFYVVEVRFQPKMELWCDYDPIDPWLDHAQIIESAINHLRQMLDNSTIAFAFLPEVFTLLDLQKVHEAILGRPLEKVCFRKRLLGRVFADGRRLRPTGESRATKGRPAKVYRLA